MSYLSKRQKASIILRQIYNVCRLKKLNDELLSDDKVLRICAHILSSAPVGPIYSHKNKKRPDGSKVTLSRKMGPWPGLNIESLTDAISECGHTPPQELIEEVACDVSRWRAAGRPPMKLVTISSLLCLSAEERILAKAWLLPAIDETKDERKERQRIKHVERNREMRKFRGATPRSQSLSQTKPWEALGISRSTWERRRRNGQVQVDANVHDANTCDTSINNGQRMNLRQPESPCIQTVEDLNDSLMEMFTPERREFEKLPGSAPVYFSTDRLGYVSRVNQPTAVSLSPKKLPEPTS